MLSVNLIEEVSKYQTESLTQWDTDQILQISGVTYKTTPAVHFANKKSAKALVVTPTLISKGLTVDIPNSLLRQPYPIVAYIYSYDNDSGSTELGITIPVIPRIQPDDYIFPGDKGSLTLALINAKVAMSISDSTAKVNNLISAKTTELETLKTEKETALNNLISSKTQALDDLQTSKTEELNTLKSTKEAELDALADQFIADVNANVTHDNLLINGNFEINQRGGTVYPQSDTWKYSVDRWKYIGLMTVTANDLGSVTLAKENNAESTYFVQSLERVTVGDCVLSFQITAIEGTLAAYIEGGDAEIQTYTKPGTYSIRSRQGASAIVFRLDGETTSVVLAWAKLEYGSIATPFYPRPYTEELRLCHYFYQVYDRVPIFSINAEGSETYFGFVLIDPIRKEGTLRKTGLLDSAVVELTSEIVSYNLTETTLVNVTFDTTITSRGVYLSCAIDAEIYS